MLRTFINQTKSYAKQQTRQYAQAHRYRPNPGIRRQAKAETNDIQHESTHWDDDLSKHEGDLVNTSKVYEQYQQESETEKEKLRHNLVRNKYFNVKKLSFLTWTEMEQIRLLHHKDPEEWNEQKLAESFPADAPTIQKVLKARWQPREAKRIAKHDEKVLSNWQAFVNGELNEMDHQFSEHLRKFSTRNLNLNLKAQNYDAVLKKEMPQPKGTEFLGIITSCKKYSKAEPKRITSEQITNVQPKRSTKELPAPSESIDSQKLYAFKPSNSDQKTAGNRSNNDDILFGNSSRTDSEQQQQSIEQSSAANPFVSKYESTEVQLHENDLKNLSTPSIRHHIVIPYKLFQEGATYRLDDCYYDDDGEFLYRVPGMTKS